ncbi:exodeoxyribonuclease V gamma subunit [Escherichia coli]|uniref:Exodeoxyribonuclease V gamma subunit n=1 Tax=Escherichia coli TaxID=562 RepID=A0A2X1NIE6_ECOLX|nr:exodeoxyribonuclease V gamma subunit [Escherichia coli]
MPCWMTIPRCKNPYEIPSGYEGNMMVRGEGDDIWYQRLWRQLTPETMEAIVEQSQRFLLPLFRFNQS